MQAFIAWMFILCVAGLVTFVVVYAKATPEQREKINEGMQKAGQDMNRQMQQWNEERRQAKAYKRARNAVIWDVVGKIMKKM